jgi:hypothetical protein
MRNLIACIQIQITRPNSRVGTDPGGPRAPIPAAIFSQPGVKIGDPSTKGFISGPIDRLKSIPSS